MAEIPQILSSSDRPRSRRLFQVPHRYAPLPASEFPSHFLYFFDAHVRRGGLSSQPVERLSIFMVWNLQTSLNRFDYADEAVALRYASFALASGVELRF